MDIYYPDSLIVTFVVLLGHYRLYPGLNILFINVLSVNNYLKMK